MPTHRLARKKSRLEIRDNASGYIAQTFDALNQVGSSTLIDGTVYYMAVGLRAGDLITGGVVLVTTIGASVTLSKVGLYDKSMNRLALSADQGTGWQSLGLKQIAFSAAYQVTSDDLYYAAVVSKASVTLPTLLRSNANIITALSGKTAIGGNQTGQTDLPSPGTLAQTAPIYFWVGLY